ncbi:MAG: hypothetical protein QOJ29_1097 [Thermoleophilaceae bacterium]|jgi:hypothetical protein|nr:hypothetical protein [Thermoleophilaceae bacterium]
MALQQEVSFLSLDELHPDRLNPRFPEDERTWQSDVEVLAYIEEQYFPLEIAESIARQGFWGSEPLVVTQEHGQWIVLEGNRRLAALAGLARADVRSAYRDPPTWEQAAAQREIPPDTAIPVVVADERSDADALIGFRHIAGILDWEPFERARFVAHLVDVRGLDFPDVADAVGEEENVVRLLYRNQAILREARAAGQDQIVEHAEERFGTFTAALNRTALREFIRVPSPGYVRERDAQLGADALDAFVELLGWIYGAGDEAPKVIEESRDLRRLAEVVASPAALEELRRTRDLEAAHALSPGPARDVSRRLRTAISHLEWVAEREDLLLDQAVLRELVEEIRRLVDRLLQAVDATDGDDQ